MTLSLSLSPRAEAKLIERAASAGEDPTALATRLLERVLSGDSPAGPVPSAPAARDADAAGRSPDLDAIGPAGVHQFDATLEELFSADTRPLPDAPLTYSRADIYFDHD